MQEVQGKKLSVLGHLRELRQRLMKSVIAVIITTAVAFIFADQIFAILVAPAGGTPLIFVELTEMFTTYFKVCLIAGTVLAMPVIMYHFMMFITPALKPAERRAMYLALPWIMLMFALGVIFAYFVLLPRGLEFLFGFGSEIAVPQIRIGNYVTIVARFLLAMGLVFEVPVVLTFLARVGLVTSKKLAQKRRVSIIIVFVVAAIITPTVDPVNQSLVALPLLGLYEMSIWLAKVAERRRKAATVAAPVSLP